MSKTHKAGPWWHEHGCTPEESGIPGGTDGRIVRHITPEEDEMSADEDALEDVLAEANEADFDLIAAAPELLSALRAFMREDGCFCEAAFGAAPGVHPRHSDECIAACSAIAKATGDAAQ